MSAMLYTVLAASGGFVNGAAVRVGAEVVLTEAEARYEVALGSVAPTGREPALPVIPVLLPVDTVLTRRAGNERPVPVASLESFLTRDGGVIDAALAMAMAEIVADAARVVDAAAVALRATLGPDFDGKQDASTKLSALAGLTWAADKLLYTTGPGAVATADLTGFARTLLDDADQAAARGTLGLGTAAVSAAGDFQTASTKLSALAGLTWAADKLLYATGSGTAATADLTGFARTLLDDADQAAARGTLGLGTAAVAAAAAFAAAVHSHAIADVSGLQSVLDGKASNVTGVFSTRVGINTATPITRLHVVGDASAPAAAAFGDFQANGQVIVSGATSSTKRLALGVDTASAAMAGVIQAIESSVATRPLLLNPSGGPVGVNTTNPLTALDVAGIIRPGSYTVATVPAGVVGGLISVTNARKVGEASGSGTGVIAYFSNGSWRRFSDDTAIAA